VFPKSCDWAIHGSPPCGPFHDTYTSLPSLLIAITGLSFHETLPHVGTGVDQVCPWSVDFVNTTLKPFM
jgi:hypothetical protein